MMRRSAHVRSRQRWMIVPYEGTAFISTAIEFFVAHMQDFLERVGSDFSGIFGNIGFRFLDGLRWPREFFGAAWSREWSRRFPRIARREALGRSLTGEAGAEYLRG